MADQSFWQKQINGVGYEPFAPERGIFAVLGKQGMREHNNVSIPDSRRLFGALCGGSVLVGTKMLACPAEIRLAQCEKGFAFGGYDTLSLKINHILVVFRKSFRHRPSWQKEAGP